MALADIALDRLTRVAPQLAKKVISFYDMSDELAEESGIKAGVFILKVGGSQFYVPITAKGGTVFPIDSIYSREDSRFIPLTNASIDYVLASGQKVMGTPGKIPTYASKNPDVTELVEPPRTGKTMYAGTPLPEALAQLSPEGKTFFLSKIASEQELMKSIHALGVDVKEMQGALLMAKTAESTLANDHEVLNTDAPVSVVYEPREGLEDEAIQMILRQGFAIIGEHPFPRMAVEYSKSTEGYTRIGAGCPNQAYEVVFKDGKNKVGFVPDMLKAMGLGEMPSKGEAPNTRRVGANDTIGRDMIIFEDGSYSSCSNLVIRQVPRDFIGTIKNLMDKGNFIDLPDVEPGDRIMVVTPSGFAGPLSVGKISSSEAGVCIQTYGSDYLNGLAEIFISDNMHGDALLDGATLYVNNTAKALILKDFCRDDVETDLNRAIMKAEYSQANLVKEAHTLDFDGVEYSFDGAPIGTIEKIAKVLAVDCKLDAGTTQYFIKRAQKQSRVMIQMSKQAEINGVGPDDNSGPVSSHSAAANIKTPIPEYGDVASPEVGNAMSARIDTSESRNKKRKPSLNVELIKQAAATKDKQIVEASIMSEILKDPAMGETISSYMPVIDEALDKIGRTILLLRIKSEEMLEKISPEEYSNLIASLRNTYKLLGENRLTLEQLVTNGGER